MAFDFYFAGTQCVEADEEIQRLNGNVLKSYLNDKTSIERWFERRKNGWTGKLMIDNGAFTVHRKGGTIDIDKYIEWINSHIDDADYFIALDKIPGHWGKVRTHADFVESGEVSWSNYLYMRERVVDKSKLLPTFHMGESFEILERYLKLEGLNYMCLSAFKDITNAGRECWYEECFARVADAGRLDMKFHCLGSATISNAEKFPFYSMDATSWIMSGMNGVILTEYGPITVGRKSMLTKVEREALAAVLEGSGFTLKDLSDDYKCRMVMNVRYLYHKSINTKHIGKVKRKRRLF